MHRHNGTDYPHANDCPYCWREAADIQSEAIKSLRAQLDEKERELTNWREGFKEMAGVLECMEGHELIHEQAQTVMGVIESYLPPRTAE